MNYEDHINNELRRSHKQWITKITKQTMNYEDKHNYETMNYEDHINNELRRSQWITNNELRRSHKQWITKIT